MPTSDLAAIVARAAARRPGPVAERSLAQARHLQAAVIARRRSAEAIPLPDPPDRPGPLRVAPAETWCLRCGENLNTTGYCLRCGSQQGRPVVAVLREGEFYIAS